MGAQLGQAEDIPGEPGWNNRGNRQNWSEIHPGLIWALLQPQAVVPHGCSSPSVLVKPPALPSLSRGITVTALIT